MVGVMAGAQVNKFKSILNRTLLRSLNKNPPDESPGDSCLMKNKIKL
jgi:hypothetical protein